MPDNPFPLDVKIEMTGYKTEAEAEDTDGPN